MASSSKRQKMPEEYHLDEEYITVEYLDEKQLQNGSSSDDEDESANKLLSHAKRRQVAEPGAGTENSTGDLGKDKAGTWMIAPDEAEIVERLLRSLGNYPEYTTDTIAVFCTQESATIDNENKKQYPSLKLLPTGKRVIQCLICNPGRTYNGKLVPGTFGNGQFQNTIGTAKKHTKHVQHVRAVARRAAVAACTEDILALITPQDPEVVVGIRKILEQMNEL